MAPEHFEDKQIDFLISHTKKITILQNKSLGVELDLLAGWIIVAGKNTVGYIEKNDLEDIIEEKNVGRNFAQYVLESMQIADGRVCVKGYSRKAWSHFQLRDRFRCHQQRRNLERHRQPGLSAGTGGVEETWDWKNGIYKLF